MIPSLPQQMLTGAATASGQAKSIRSGASPDGPDFAEQMQTRPEPDRSSYGPDLLADGSETDPLATEEEALLRTETPDLALSPAEASVLRADPARPALTAGPSWQIPVSASPARPAPSASDGVLSPPPTDSPATGAAPAKAARLTAEQVPPTASSLPAEALRANRPDPQKPGPAADLPSSVNARAAEALANATAPVRRQAETVLLAASAHTAQVPQDHRRERAAPTFDLPPQASPMPKASPHSVTVAPPSQPLSADRPAVLTPDQALAPIADTAQGPGAAPAGSARASVLHPQAAASADMARHAGQQISVAIARSGPGTTDIALNPPELGRVRLTLTAQDNAIVLHIAADRPETQDLLRRHVDQLAQEFRDIGYTSLSFTFGDRRSAGPGAAPDPAATDLDGTGAPDEAPLPSARPPRLAGGGLDLRL